MSRVRVVMEVDAVIYRGLVARAESQDINVSTLLRNLARFYTSRTPEPPVVKNPRHQSTILSEPVTQQIIELYKTGLSMKQIALQVGMNLSSVDYRLRAAGIPRRPLGRPRKNRDIDITHGMA